MPRYHILKILVKNQTAFVLEPFSLLLSSLTSPHLNHPPFPHFAHYPLPHLPTVLLLALTITLTHLNQNPNPCRNPNPDPDPTLSLSQMTVQSTTGQPYSEDLKVICSFLRLYRHVFMQVLYIYINIILCFYLYLFIYIYIYVCVYIL